MAVFTTWADELRRAKNAIADRNWDTYFLQSVENHAKMRTSYTLIGNIQGFIEWLEMKASQEAMGFENGTMPFIVGGA